MFATTQVIVRGSIRNGDSADPIFNAKIRHRGTRASVQTAKDGSFEIALSLPAGTRQTTLTVLKTGFWAKRFTCKIPADGIADVGPVDIEILAPLFTDKVWGYLLGLLGPRLHSWILSRTNMELVLVTMLVLLVIPPAALAAIAAGWDVPRTEADERIREFLQAHEWTPNNADVAFKNLRRVYRAHVRYRIGPGEHIVNQTIVIERTSEVTITKRATFKMGRDGGFLVLGKLNARGESDAPIRFLPASTTDGWRNLVFWENGSSESRLEHCEINGGRGCNTAANPESGILRYDTGSQKTGGGLLIYNTSVVAQHVLIENCMAAFGGGIYIRNSKEEANRLGSSRFTNLTVSKCEAHLDEGQHQLLVGGGGVFVQRAAPDFVECKFEANQVHGDSSCGGGVYIGTEARGRFSHCQFLSNWTTACGGGLYARECGELDDDFTSGVRIEDSSFTDNHAGGLGGGMAADNARVRLSRVAFRDNHVRDYVFKGRTTPVARGGGLSLAYDDRFTFARGRNLRNTIIEDCQFENNETAFPAPGEPSTENYAGGGLAITSALPLKLSLGRVTFSNNRAAKGRAAATSPLAAFENWSGKWDGVDPDAVYVFNTPIETVAVDRTHALPSSCYGDRPAGAKVDAIVLHFISAINVHPLAPYDLDAVLGIFTSAGEPTSSHYLIDRTGKIYGLVDERKAAWHAGASRMPDGRESVNNFSIGIEVMHRVDDPPTDKQYEALAALIRDLRRRHDIPLDHIVGHELVRTLWKTQHPNDDVSEKNDPGPLFHWGSLMNRLIVARD